MRVTPRAVVRITLSHRTGVREPLHVQPPLMLTLSITLSLSLALEASTLIRATVNRLREHVAGMVRSSERTNLDALIASDDVPIALRRLDTGRTAQTEDQAAGLGRGQG